MKLKIFPIKIKKEAKAKILEELENIGISDLIL